MKREVQRLVVLQVQFDADDTGSKRSVEPTGAI